MASAGLRSPARLASRARRLRCVLVLLATASAAAPVRAAASGSGPPETAASHESLSPRPESAPSDARDPFTKGVRDWAVTAGTSRHHSIAQLYLAQVSVSHYIGDGVAIDYGGIFAYADAKRTSGGVLGGPELGMRWHFAKTKRWSTYLEGLVGAVLQQHPLSEHSLRFNFDLEPGCGAIYRVGTALALQGGCRWHHLSNARIRGKARNFGYDGPMVYVGLRRSF